VLVVDDNADLAENVAELFASAGYSTHVERDGDGACAAAEQRPFDLAVVDIRLPNESGVEIAGRLQARCEDAEIILMTANATLDTAIAAVGQAAFAYVQKPFDPAELLSLGERALGQVQLRRDRARLERELARSEALHRNVVDSSEAYIVVLDDAGEVRMWNRSAAACTGWPPHEVLGRPLIELLGSDTARQRLGEALQKARGDQATTGLELPMRTREGTTRTVRWNITRFTAADAGTPTLLAVGEDLTDQLDLERRAAEAEAMASIATLTAGLAHEIRNPLNAAALQLELLGRGARKLQDADARERIESRARIVREELDRLTNLLNDFLNLARPRKLELKEVRLCALVDEVIALEEPAANAAGIRLTRRVSGEDLAVRGDHSMLKQVLVNLVMNALDAMRPRGHGRVTVACEPTSSARVELGVEDDGPGVPPEVADRLFVPFVTSKEAGSGLGLTIVKRIVDRHGGSIQVSSEPGGGTRVRVSLERAD
jgi:PAS domain S-box-containing protein